MKYLLLNTEDTQYAWLLSRALWRITQPASNEDTTMYYSTPIEGPDMVALPIGGDAHRVDENAKINTLLILIQSQYKDEVGANLENAKGGRVTIEELLPEDWKPFLKTREELTDLGWFATE